MNTVSFMMYISKLEKELKEDFENIYLPFYIFNKRIYTRDERQEKYDKYLIKRREIFNFIRLSNDPVTKEYFNNIVNTCTYQIVNGNMLIIMKIDLQLEKNNECPICWEERDTVVVLKCGHIICIKCLEKFVGIDAFKGTVKNRMLHMYRNGCSKCPSCPMCRCSNAFTDFYIYNFTTKEVLTDVFFEEHNSNECLNTCCLS